MSGEEFGHLEKRDSPLRSDFEAMKSVKCEAEGAASVKLFPDVATCQPEPQLGRGSNIKMATLVQCFR